MNDEKHIPFHIAQALSNQQSVQVQMNKNKLRVKVAEACGWKPYHEKGGKLGEPEFYSPTGEFSLLEDVPNYPEDLNACAQFEAMLSDGECNKYIKALFNLIQGTETHWRDEFVETPWITAFFIATATTEQRCRAFLKVKGIEV